MAKRNAAPAPVAEGQTDHLAVDIPSAARVPKIRQITRTEIHPDPEQPRQAADAELRDSLARNGMLQPITVRPHPTLSTEWMIVDGERRWRSSEGVLNDLPCIVRQDMDTLARRLATQLEANTGKALTPLEEARAFAQIMTHEELTAGELAAFLGRAPSTVAERVALLELGPWLPMIETGEVVMSHAVKVLLPLRTLPADVQTELAEAVRKELLRSPDSPSVDDFRDLVRAELRPFLYPLKKSTAYGVKNPEFNTAKHVTECECGGIAIPEGYPAKDRLYCGNPAWWKPKHAAAVKAVKAAKAKIDAELGGSAPVKDEKRVYLPEGASVRKANSWETPRDAAVLTDSNGRWNVGYHGQRIDFNPAEVAGNCRPEDLVELRGGPHSYPRVAILDRSLALEHARQAWATRWQARREELAEELSRKLVPQVQTHFVQGPGARMLLRALVDAGDVDDASVLVDVALALELPVPSSDAPDAVDVWLGELPIRDLERLATGVATFAALEFDSVSEIVRNEEWAALQEIEKKKVPWLKAPKGKKAAKAPAPLTVAGKKLGGETIPLALDDDEEEGGWGAGDVEDDDRMIVAGPDDDGDDLWDATEDDDEEAPLVEARPR